MEDIVFASPGALYLLLLLVPMTVWYVLKHNGASATVQVSTLKVFKGTARTYKHYLRHILFVFRSLAIAAMIVALARPQSSNSWENITTEGIDIVVSLDLSTSMLAEDLKPNRLEAAKNVAMEFVSGRELDRVGLVVFAGESFTQCPLTTDRAVVVNLFKGLKCGIMEDGTAIGLGLATAVNRLKDSETKSKVVILLTDGVNNRGGIAPLTAAEIAKKLGIRVYTIGVGTKGEAPYPVQTPYGIQYRNMEVDIDEPTLKEISQMTNGKYFRANNNKKLKQIYEEIDKLEKSKIEVKEYSRKEEEYLPFAIFAGILLLLEILLRNTILRNIP